MGKIFLYELRLWYFWNIFIFNFDSVVTNQLITDYNMATVILYSDTYGSNFMNLTSVLIVKWDWFKEFLENYNRKSPLENLDIQRDFANMQFIIPNL